MAEYYGQRAKGGAGLILSEGMSGHVIITLQALTLGTLISHQGSAWPNAPGIWDEEHADAWKLSVDGVHAHGVPFVLQIAHVGRMAHPDMEEQKISGEPVYAPSAVAARGGKVCAIPRIHLLDAQSIVLTVVPHPRRARLRHAHSHPGSDCHT